MWVYYLRIVLLLVFLMTSTVGPAAENKVKFAFDRDFPPFTFVEQDQVKGYAVDVLKAALEGTDIDLHMVPADWEKVQEDLADGKVQITAGMVRTAERETKYLFADQPLCPFKLTVFVQEHSNVNAFAQIKGKRIATQKGSWYQTVLKETGDVNLVLFDTEEAGLKALVAGEVQAFAGAELTAHYYIKKLGISNIRALEPPLRERSLYIAVAKDRRDLLDSVNNGVKRIKSNGVFDSIYRKWFPTE